ncbi:MULTISPECIES: hypothetical protein [unclassified Campylobacter]|uniref:hypothetical protein n=1 Tax=unclassified Campylobacter TaxID=2593542 RepID=UPI001D3424BF|nr:hypothetical protein [Campylobacter sp. RM12651]MBZ7991136.1 sel1 repeat family protein [Campylobacter sp. RM9331]MBZ8005629.1 sel1 repeat family protein [Campylobacter sp. RM9332]ULO03553.1 hypothetical protein AVBRAN_1095 [Campylobacter sp. RM12651]
MLIIKKLIIFLFFISSIENIDKLTQSSNINDKNQAIKIYKYYCDLNYALACYKLGLEYFNNEKLFIKSCDLGYANACNKLADIYILDINKNRFYNKLSCEYGNDFDCLASFDTDSIDFDRLAKYCRKNKKYTCDFLRKESIKHNKIDYFVVSDKNYERLYKLCKEDNSKACFTLALELNNINIFSDILYKKSCELGESKACMFLKDNK